MRSWQGILIVLVLLLGILQCKRSPEALPNPGDTSSAQLSQYEMFYTSDSIRVVIDRPDVIASGFITPLVVFALPNGNSIEWTMGKQIDGDDDWHYDIQHIDAQTRWLRETSGEQFVVAYLEAPAKSWPHWKRQQADPGGEILDLLELIRERTGTTLQPLTLSSHSGGGALINGLIESQTTIPHWIHRLVFIDSNYGYTDEIGIKLRGWIKADSRHHLVTFAYNDSIALYKGKPFVSRTGGTWYRTRMMLKNLKQEFSFQTGVTDSLITYRTESDQILIILKENPDRGIYHTEQVALNGFIHSLLFATPPEGRGYDYFSVPCYEDLIRKQTPSFVATD